jgi:signal transduction histidine kinase
VRRFHDLSLRSKLVLVMTGTSLLALGIAFVAYLVFDRVASQSETARQTSALAEIVGANSAAALTFDDEKAGADTLATLRLQPGIVAARLFTADGKSFATFRQATDSATPLPERPEPDNARVDGRRLRLFQRVILHGETIGTVFIEVDLSEVRARQARYAVVLLLLMLGSSAVAALAANRLQAPISRPVLELAAAARAITSGESYTVRAAETSHDEIGELTRAFLRMIEQIQTREEELRAAQGELRRHVVELEQEMSERKQAQEALRESEAQLAQAQKMEAVGSLAGGVAHDFNNLLQALLAQAQLLRSMLSEGSARAIALTQEMEEHIQHGAALTRQLLLFSRRETAKLERLDLNDLLRNVTRMLRRLVRASIELSIELAPGRLLVKGDRGQLVQVLVNLTVNASDAMPGGGRLMIRSGETADGRAWLSVQDNGEGIPDAIRARIFEPFFTTKSEAHGTGLGLSVVHGIVLRHGGSIDMRSIVGEGTTFTVTLPRVAAVDEEEATSVSSLSPLVPSGHHERILVVEDESVTRASLAQLLEELGYEVVTAGSGEEAGALPADRSFDLLLTDLMLPGIAGPELARGLKDRWPDLHVILMSGYTEDEVVRREVIEGSVRFLQKPLDLGTLARELRAALDEVPVP